MRRKITDIKKVIFGISSIAVAVGVMVLPLSVSSKAADYKLADNCLTVSGTEDFIDVSGDIYDKKSKITSVIIENGVTGIGQNAFEGFTSLKEVTIPSSVKDIKPGAFADCGDVKVTLEINDDVNISKKYYSVFSEDGVEYRISIPKNVTIANVQYVDGTLINRTGEEMQNLSVEKDGIEAEFALSAGGSVSYAEEHKVLAGNVTCKKHGCFHIASQEATCGDHGSKEYYRCIACAKVFADSAWETEITNYDDLFIPATGEHVWNEGIVETEATATENGKKAYTCTVCGAAKQEIIYAQGTETKKATTKKDIIITQIKGNSMSYYELANSTKLIPDAEWENLIGYGKKKTIKIASTAKYYCLTSPSKTAKVSKKKFKKQLFKSEKFVENGVTYYTGLACRITIKNGKCVKLVQLYQA